MRVFCFSRFLVVMCMAMGAAIGQAADTTTTAQSSPEAAAAQPPPVLDKTPGDFLPRDPTTSQTYTGFYAEIPANLEQGVRWAAEDNYTSSTPFFLEQLKLAKDPKERARVLMWLGITQAQEATDYDSAAGWYGVATSATMHLQEAIKQDPEVFKAPDVARALGHMIGSGWAKDSPEAALESAIQKAEKEKQGVDFFYAGVILQRVTQRSWQWSDTKQDDEKTLGLLAKAIVFDATRYDIWPIYLNAVARLQMMDLFTTDSQKMFDYFHNMRAPTMGDPGPVSLYFRAQSILGMPPDIAEVFVTKYEETHPGNPWAPYTLAQIAMSTSPTVAIQKFEEIIRDIESGKLKLLPREQGYRISSYYKLGFLYKAAGELDKALEVFEKVRTLNSRYAETYFNIAETYQFMADKETTGPKKLELLEKAVTNASTQQRVDYMGQGSSKADNYRRTLSREIRRIKNDLGLLRKDTDTTIPQPSKPLHIQF